MLSSGMFYPTGLFVSQEKILPGNIIGQQPGGNCPVGNWELVESRRDLKDSRRPAWEGVLSGSSWLWASEIFGPCKGIGGQNS